MVENFLRGGAAVNVLARDCGARVVVADFGVANPIGDSAALVRCSLGAGTANIARGPAMTRERAEAAIEAGARLVMDAIDAGADLVATGDMGIGNTTPASAITAAVTGAAADTVTGRGTGVDDDGWRRKVDAVRRALAVNQPDARDGVDVLAKVGGFEIGGLGGAILGGVAGRAPVAPGGFIAGGAAPLGAPVAAPSLHPTFPS